MVLFSADSRIRAALFTESERLGSEAPPVGSGSVINLYRWPTDDGILAVSSVHV